MTVKSKGENSQEQRRWKRTGRMGSQVTFEGDVKTIFTSVFPFLGTYWKTKPRKRKTWSPESRSPDRVRGAWVARDN
jgi:hypothetical protein